MFLIVGKSMYIDKLKFTQVIYDLIQYCCSRTQSGGKIHLSCNVEDAPEFLCSSTSAQYLLIRVLDYGTKIDQELFTRDFAYSNMMIYLHIIQYIMELHKGTVGK